MSNFEKVIKITFGRRLKARPLIYNESIEIFGYSQYVGITFRVFDSLEKNFFRIVEVNSYSFDRMIFDYIEYVFPSICIHVEVAHDDIKVLSKSECEYCAED